eukprot:scaffold120732_cov60-Phaeocystis_antarctica.AAC.1
MKEVSTHHSDYARRAYLDDDDQPSARCTFLLTMAILTMAILTLAILTMAILTMAILTRVTSTARSRRPPSPPYATQGSNQGLAPENATQGSDPGLGRTNLGQASDVRIELVPAAGGAPVVLKASTKLEAHEMIEPQP